MEMTSTVGVDMAAAPKNTSIASIVWNAASARVETLHLSAEDDLLLHWLHHPDHAVGVDCPLGWPVGFVELVSRHESSALVMPSGQHEGWRRSYTMRETDIYVRDRTGLTPLSVSADRIGHAAIRLAAVMSHLGPHISAPRDGSGAIAEVYPAAALRFWGLPSRGYKGTSLASQRQRSELVRALLTQAPWLDLAEHESDCISSDHALDAVICALIARCVQRGFTERPSDREVACKEGWIHLPTVPLSRLVP